MKRIVLSLLVVFLIAINMTSCAILDENVKIGPTQLKAEEDEIMDKGPVEGGSVSLFSTPPDTLNPLLTRNIYVRDFSGLMFESLVRIDSMQRPVPELAESWSVSEDGLIWTFNLRKDVLWQDGTPLTAEDVEFSLQFIKNEAYNSPYLPAVGNITAFAAVDRNVFRIFLRNINAFTAELMTFPIIPKHYYDNYGNELSTSIPLGSGPYRYSNRSNASEIILTSNDKWWGSGVDGGVKLKKPYIPEVKVKIFQNVSDEVPAFNEKVIDLIYVNHEDYSKYYGRTDVVMRKYPGRAYEYISFNTKNKILEDKAVRQAIAYAVDVQALINETIPGAACISDIPVVPDTWLNDSEDVTYAPDKQKARETLRQNGWEEINNLWYKDIKGVATPLKLEMLVNDTNETRKKVADRIREQLTSIGIEMKVTSMSWDNEFKKINSGKYDLALLGVSVSSVKDISFCYASYEIASGHNTARYENTAVDNYLSSITAESDKARVKNLFVNLKNILTEDLPYLGLYFNYDAVVFNKGLRGELSPNMWDRLHDASGWYIPATGK